MKITGDNYKELCLLCNTKNELVDEIVQELAMCFEEQFGEDLSNKNAWILHRILIKECADLRPKTKDGN